MLSILTDDFYCNTAKQQKCIAINSLIRRASEHLGTCLPGEIENVIQSVVTNLGKIEVADKVGWVVFSESGDLVESFFSGEKLSTFLLLKKGLRGLPWCLSELNAGRPVVVCDRRDLSPFAKIDGQFMSNSCIRSIALIPSHSFGPCRGALILLSISGIADWSDEIVDQSALLGSIVFNAYGRQLAQRELQRSTSCFHELFVASPIGMAILNKYGSLLSVNNALCGTLGYSEEELRKMPYKQLVASFNHNTREFLRFLNNAEAVNCQMKQTLMRKDQTLISPRIRAHSLKRSPGEDFQTLIMIENPVEQRQANGWFHGKQIEGRTFASQLIQSQENERKRLARELHDDIGQRLSLVASEVALLTSERVDTTSIFVNRLNALRDDLDSLCSDIHCMSHDLHSYKLQHLGLKSALKDLCRRLTQPNFHIDLYIDNFNEPRLEEISLCLYRVAQEALHNALKHAHASTVAVTLTKVQSMFYMTVQDSGIGFVRSASSQGLGLVSMSERLKLVNGHMKLHSIPGRGTEIWIAIPDTEDVIEPSCLVSVCGGGGRA